MKDYLYKLNDIFEAEAEEMAERLSKGGAKVSEASAGYADKITHILKSLACLIAMEEEKGASSRNVNTTDGYNSYRGSYDRASGRRGRDSMGRFTSRSYGDDYSGAADEMIEHLEQAKECAEDSDMKRKLQSMIREIKG
jgi:hypothetical protein